MNPGTISIIRRALFGVGVFFSFICIGTAGHLLSIYGKDHFTAPDYLGMGVAVSVITMVLVGASIIVDLLRKGAFTSMVAVELAWTFIISVLWVASAGLSTSSYSLGCVFIKTKGFIVTRDNGLCSEAQALIAFSWLNWFLFLGWFGFLLTATIISHTRGNTSVWVQSVSGTDFFAYKQVPAQQGVPQQQAYGQQPYNPPMQQGAPMQQQYTGQTMQQQYTGTPVQQPQQMAYPPQGGYVPTGAQV